MRLSSAGHLNLIDFEPMICHLSAIPMVGQQSWSYPFELIPQLVIVLEYNICSDLRTESDSRVRRFASKVCPRQMNHPVTLVLDKWQKRGVMHARTP